MSNVKTIIAGHNARILNSDTQPDSRSCNCRVPQECPLEGHCLTECVIYKASVSGPSIPEKHYFGLTEGIFKTRYNQHMRSFRSEEDKHETELSKYVWRLKDANKEFEVKWKVEERATPYKCGTRRCDVCLTEKMVIATANPRSMLNKRSEIVSTCRHRAKFRLDKLKKTTAPT